MKRKVLFKREPTIGLLQFAIKLRDGTATARDLDNINGKGPDPCPAFVTVADCPLCRRKRSFKATWCDTCEFKRE
jgi:hypothetical protein